MKGPMMLKRSMVVLIAFALVTCSWATLAMSVTFINPGKSDEVYWVTVSRAMEASARSLDIHFDVFYAEREPPRSIEIAKQIAARPAAHRPDYVVIANEAGTGPELLRILDAAGIKTFIGFSGLSRASERSLTGAPREKFMGWLGSLEPSAEEGGYLTAQALIRKGREQKARGKDGKLHLLAISGDRATITSVKRSNGMRRAVAEARDVVIDQEVFGGFNREKAAEQAEWLYQRFPEAKLIWAGNDLMAFGAMQSWEKRGGKAGSDAWFSGINTSNEAMESVKSGRLTALAGGHFILGAWAMVVLYDYEHGHDFAAEEGFEMTQSMFTLFSAKDADLFMSRYGQGNFDSLNFRAYSKVLNPKLKRYNFNFRQLLR